MTKDELEKQDIRLNKLCFDYQKKEKRIEELEKENAELKEKLNFSTQYYRGEKAKDQLTKAKELIENIIRVTWGEGWNYSLDWKVKAEKFLKEIEK